MANLKAVKRKMSKWGVLGNAFLSVVLAVSLMPSYAAFGDDGQEESPKATQEQNQQVVNEQTADGVQGDGENTNERLVEDGSAESKTSDKTSDEAADAYDFESAANASKADEEAIVAEEERAGDNSAEDAVTYGQELLARAVADGVADASNPNTAVELGKYAPGTYTITANLFIPKALNPFVALQAYCTNPMNPLGVVEDSGLDPVSVTGVPDYPMTSNATLVVNEDDTLDLTIPIANPVFTIQGIGSGDGVSVASVTTRPGSYGPSGANGELARVDHTSRISSVTFKITKDSGFTNDGSNGYMITGCTQYPTILGVDWHVDMGLTLDMSGVAKSAKYASDPTANQLTYNGYEQQGVAYDVEKCDVVSGSVVGTNAGGYSAVIKPKEGFKWLDGSDGERTVNWSIAKAKLSRTYETVVACGLATTAQEVVDKLPSADEVNSKLHYEGFVGSDTLESLGDLDTRTFSSWNLGNLEYALWMPDLFPLKTLVPTALTGEFEGGGTELDNYEIETKAVAHISLCAAQMPIAKDMEYNGFAQLGITEADGTAFSFSGSQRTNPTPWNDFASGVLNGLQTKSFIDAGEYSVTLNPSETWTYPDGYWSDGTSGPKTLSFKINPAELTVKADDLIVREGDTPSFDLTYSGFKGSDSASNSKDFVEPKIEIYDGDQLVSANDLEAGKDYTVRLSGGSALNYTFKYEESALRVVSRDCAAMPKVVSGLVYNGEEQTGVMSGSGYTLEGETAKDAGTYTATAILDKDCERWADGDTSRIKTLEYSIDKAKLTATYVPEVVLYDDIVNGSYFPAFDIQVEGFVDGENPALGNVADYVAPVAVHKTQRIAPKTADELLGLYPRKKGTQSFEAANGSAKNYDFVYAKWEDLNIVGSGNKYAVGPTVKTGLVYTGKEQTGTTQPPHATYIGRVSGIDAGTYTVQAIRDADTTQWQLAAWNAPEAKPDQGNDAISYSWSIAQAPLKVSAKDITVNYGETPNLADAYELSGLVNGEDPARGTVADFVAPTVSVEGHEGEDLSSLEPGTYTLVASGGSAKNYSFYGYKTATLTVKAKGEVVDPQVSSSLVYTGAEQQAIQANDYWTLSGDVSAKDFGEYTTTVTLNAGYTWADGTNGAKEFAWTIAKAPLSASIVDETVVAGGKAKLDVVVEGFVNSENAATAADYEAPELTGVPSSYAKGQTYEIGLAGGSAKNYEFTKYNAGTVTVQNISVGTYTVTANLSMPGEYNPVLKNTTVYANNPNNPFGIDEGTSAFPVDANKAPTEPMSMNATLVVAEDGTKTLVLPIDNPVFTTQSLGTCEQLPSVWVKRSKAPFATKYSVNAAGSYGKYDTRISQMGAVLSDIEDSGIVTYSFKGSTLYAIPLDQDISPDGDVALELTVDYDSLKQTSDNTEVTFANTGDNGSALGELAKTDSGDNGGNSGNNGSNGGNSSGNQGGNSGDNGGSNGSDGSNGGASNGGSTTVGTTTSGHFAAGTYTVSANLWFDKATTGLPLNPHLTNGGFPPSTPVSNNATMTVDASGHAWVSAPVVIQDKVMTVNNVWGSGVSYDGSTVTIDLGTPTADQTQFAGTCTSSVTIGWLAQTIAAGIFNGVWDHTWTTNWEVDLVAGSLPASGGGELPAAAQAILNGENGVAASGDAAAAALAAAEDGAAKSGDAAKSGKAADGKSSGSAKSGVAGAVEDLADAAASNPAVAIALGCVAVLAVAGAAGGACAYRRKKRAAAAADGAASDAASK